MANNKPPQTHADRVMFRDFKPSVRQDPSDRNQPVVVGKPQQRNLQKRVPPENTEFDYLFDFDLQ